MRYTFNNFDFDSTSLILTQNGEPVSIRHNEAKVLALLLEQKDNVISKEEILAHVWQDKVVSDQAVFQNISHLRNIFGNDAIKTFSKRGYQWQLDVDIVASVPAEDVRSELTGIADHKSSPVGATLTNNKYTWLKAASVGLVGLILLVTFFLLNPKTSSSTNETNLINIAYIPFSQTPDVAEEEQVIVFNDSNLFNFTRLEQPDVAQFEAAEELEYLTLAPTHPIVLSGHIRHHEEQFYLDFSLKGPTGQWQGQMIGTSKANVISQFEQHLQQDFIVQLITEQQSPSLKQAKLSIAHQRSPDDLIILGQLIRSYIIIGEYEKAMPLAEKLATQADAQNNTQQLGQSYLHQSKILTAKNLYELSAYKLGLAIEHFEQVNDLKRQADAWDAHSWLDHKQDNYPALKSSLLKSAELALAANDIERELHALTYLSVMAHKHHESDDKYDYLTQAEDKMTAYKLPQYRFAKIPFHHAIYSEGASAKEPHLKRVLIYTELTPDHWVAQSSRQQLMRHYIELERFDDAQELLTNLRTDNAENSFLKTLLAQAQHQQDAFISHAQRTFEQAQLAGDKSLSLDVALMLCSSPDTQVNYDFYSQYINENATAYWRRNNEKKLLALNLL